MVQISFYFLFVLLLVKPVGTFMARVYEGDIPRFMSWHSPLDKLIYLLIGVDPKEEMTWKRYAGAFLLFNLMGGLLLYAILRLQGSLPLNPQGMAGTTPDLAFNTAWSFVTNTN